MEQYNILIVEDDKEIRDGIEIFLKSQNYNVYKAADGIEGLEIIESKEIHLAIVDIMMPRMDGVTTVSYTHLDVYKRQYLFHLKRFPFLCRSTETCDGSVQR